MMRTIIVIVVIVVILNYLNISYTKIPMITTNSYNTSMTMYRTYPSRNVTRKLFQKCHQMWMDMNHNLCMVWYDNYDCDRFMRKMEPRIWNCYQKLNVGAFKADLFRLCILYQNGGIYTDAHTTPYISIREMMRGCTKKGQQHMFISALDCKSAGSGIHNGFIISSPEHPFIKECIHMIVTNVETDNYTDHILGITGPKCLARAINSVLNREKNELFREGWNEHSDLSFYLYRFQWGPFQYIYKGSKVIVSKKYCTISYMLDKMRSDTYAKKWRKKEVFKTQ